MQLQFEITSLKWLSNHKHYLGMKFLIGMRFLTMYVHGSNSYFCCAFAIWLIYVIL